MAFRSGALLPLFGLAGSLVLAIGACGEDAAPHKPLPGVTTSSGNSSTSTTTSSSGAGAEAGAGGSGGGGGMAGAAGAGGAVGGGGGAGGAGGSGGGAGGGTGGGGAPTCFDAVMNGTESDIDCGGSCPPCSSGKACFVAADCTTGVCTAGACAVAACNDLVKNGTETDVDCGSNCPKCADGLVCSTNNDCQSTVCNANLCESAQCTDSVQNGSETDIDCGGTQCSGCAPFQACLVSSDCSSKKCANMVCGAPTCVDSIQNGTETDIDCGGPSCGDCANGKNCVDANDCQSKVCTGGICQIPTCTDGVKNGTETDLDCGGPCMTKCPLGQACASPADCVTQSCLLSVCECPIHMVKMPKLGQGAYCIDATETTYAEYSSFLNANPPTGNQPAYCSWNLVYVPADNWPPLAHNRTLQHPVTDIDWCDARAYCASVGKHLCGKVGGGTNLFADHANASLSEWFNACSFQGQQAYPYGNVYSGSTCTGAGQTVQPVPVQDNAGNALLSSCEGGQLKLYQMSGNASEWEDSCDGAVGQADNCHIRGGSYSSFAADLACNAATSVARSTTAGDRGFRCCE